MLANVLFTLLKTRKLFIGVIVANDSDFDFKSKWIFRFYLKLTINLFGFSNCTNTNHTLGKTVNICFFLFLEVIAFFTLTFFVYKCFAATFEKYCNH